MIGDLVRLFLSVMGVIVLIDVTLLLLLMIWRARIVLSRQAAETFESRLRENHFWSVKGQKELYRDFNRVG
jgi:hypothetical protein